MITVTTDTLIDSTDDAPESILEKYQAASSGTTEKERFVLDDIEKANWLLGVFAKIRDEQAKNNAEADRVVGNVAKRNEELEVEYNSLMFKYGDSLKAVARAEADKRKRKSVTLFNGVITFRAYAGGLDIEDMETAMTTARAVAPETIVIETKTTEKLDKEAFLTHAQQTMEGTGEILPGVTKIEPGEAFKIDVGSAPKPSKKKSSKPVQEPITGTPAEE